MLLFPGRENDTNPFIRWKAGDPLRFSSAGDLVFRPLVRDYDNPFAKIAMSKGRRQSPA